MAAYNWISLVYYTIK